MHRTWESADKTVRKDIITTGEYSQRPTERSTCNVFLENIVATNASLVDLTEKYHSEIFDGKAEKQLVIGDVTAEIDRQIERALQMMMISEKSLVTVLITPEAIEQLVIVKVEVTLVSFASYTPIWKWTPEEKHRIALMYKETGVTLFKECRWVDAFHKFSKACKLLITLEPVKDLKLDNQLENDITNLRLVLYNNMAGCHLNRKNFEHTIALCNKVLGKEQSNVKALYRRGVAYGNLKNLEKAVADLKSATTLEPQNRTAKEQLLIYNAKLREANQNFGDMVRRMFKT